MTTTKREFSGLIASLQELKEKKLTLVEVGRIEKFCDLCRVFGLNPCGGALLDDCSAQYIYID